MANDERVERLLEALNLGANQTTNENIAKLAQHGYNLGWEAIVAELGEDEPVSFAVPISNLIGGKEEPGLIVFCERRVILFWSTGLRKPVSHIDHMPLEGLSVTSALTKLGILKGWWNVMTITGERTWNLHVPDTKAGTLGTWVQGLADGSMVANFSD